MKITAQEEYGLRCLIRLARTEAQTSTIPEIAGAEGLSVAYVGKLLGVVILLCLAELLLVPLVALLFSASLFARPLLLAGLLLTGTVGFSAVGTLFAAMLVRARTRDVLLPILLYPITVPVMIAGVRGTAALLTAPPDEAVATMWIGLLVSFDVVFVTLALWTFEPLMTE